MKTAEKFVEIMENLNVISKESSITFEENTYTVESFDTDTLDAKVTLKCEGQDDIVMSLKDLVESEDHVIEAKENPFAKKDDKKDDDKEDKEDDSEDSDKKDDDKKDDSEDSDKKDDDKKDDEEETKDEKCKK